MFKMSCEATISLRGRQSDAGGVQCHDSVELVLDVDADICTCYAAAMRARADCASVQRAGLRILVSAIHRNLSCGTAERMELVSVAVEALRRHGADAVVANVACGSIEFLARDTQVAARLDRSVIAALVAALRVRSDWLQEKVVAHTVLFACGALIRAVQLTRGAAEHAVAAGAVPTLVALLRGAEGGGWTNADERDILLEPVDLLARLCVFSSANQVAASAGVFEVLVCAMRWAPDNCTLFKNVCAAVCCSCFSRSPAVFSGRAAFVPDALAAGVPAALLASHAALCEKDPDLDGYACEAMAALLFDDDFAATPEFHDALADAFIASLRRHPEDPAVQHACCEALVKFFPNVSRALRESMLRSGLLELLSRVIRHRSGLVDDTETRIALAALFALHAVLAPLNAAVAQQAFQAGLIEACMLVAAAHDPGNMGDLPRSSARCNALTSVMILAAPWSAAGARALVCGANKLAAVLPVAVTDALRKQLDFTVRALKDLGAVARDHAPCDVAECDFEAMSRVRCCLPSCAARKGDGGVALKRCARCGSAAYCCVEH